MRIGRQIAIVDLVVIHPRTKAVADILGIESTQARIARSACPRIDLRAQRNFCFQTLARTAIEIQTHNQT